MNALMVLSAFLFSALYCFGQRSEFPVHPNGLIYSDTTMRQLTFIVDSLNLKFEICDPNIPYYSKYQAKGHYIKLDSGDITAARKDLENNIPFDDFIQKYPACKILYKEALVVKHQYRDYDDGDIVDFSVIPPNGGYGSEIRFEDKPDMYNAPVKNRWYTTYYEKSTYIKETVYGLYFLSEFAKQPLPEKYARMVQYSDCLIDTSTQIFSEKATPTPIEETENFATSKVGMFLTYIHSNTNRPEFPEDDDDNSYEDYYARYEQWDSLRISIIDRQLSKEATFQSQLLDAVTEALAQGGSGNEFEEYVARYYSAKTALDLKRNRRVRGLCGMDRSPHIHVMNIAILSAETVSWEVFLRAHLDIMDYRFDRIFYGSYARAAQQTYVRELEELGINMPDLLLGITMRVEDPAKNHYYGSIDRLGQALAETKHPAQIENQMLGMIRDTALDDYNRVLAYHLFRNYNHFIEDEAKKKENLKRLKQAVATLPEYLAGKIQVDEGW